MKNIKLLIMGIIFIIGILLLHYFNVFSQLNIDNIPKLKEQFSSLGIWAVVAYFILYIVACLFFLPGLPVTILGGVLFGPVLGTLYTVISASVGLALAFLSARYILREHILEKFSSSDIFNKIDQGVEKQGWRIIMITRLVPIFPFNIQNYLYGLTNINFFTYWILSTLFIIPGTSAYTLSVGAALSGEFSTQNIIYLGIGAICFVLVSFIPKFLKEKS